MNIIPTAQSARLAMLHRYRKPYTTINYTTLNQKFGILANASIDVNQSHSQNLIVYGNGGHHYSTSPGPITDYHISTNTALYSHIPAVLRPLGNDLTVTQRQKFALRKQMQVGSNYYIAYWARRMSVDAFSLVHKTKIVDLSTGDLISDTVFTPTSGDLSPTPPSLSDTNPSTKKYVGTFITMENFMLDAFDIAELQNVATLLYGSIYNTIISEIGFVASQTEQITVTNFDDSTSTFDEAVHCLLTDVSDGEFYNLSSATTTVTTTTEFGCSANIRQSTTEVI